MSSAAVDYARQNQARFLEELKELLRIPSISTLPEHNSDTRRAAETLAGEMKRIGLQHVRLIETAHGGAAGHPLVYGDWLHAPGKPEKSRVDELQGTGLPTLVVQGERDPFGTPEEFPPLTEMAVVPDGDHAFKMPKRAELDQQEAYDLLVEAVFEWVVREVSG